MMNNILFACAILVAISYTNARVAPFITPCKRADKGCIIKSAQAAIPKVAPGLPDLKVEPSDPLKIEEIIGDQGALKLRFRDITITGASKCKVVNIDRNLEKKSLLFEAECPIKIVGDYEANGKFSILPIEGNDKFEISTDNIKIGVDAQLETVDGSDGKKHWHIASWTHSYQPIEKVKFDLKNLFHGNPQLAEPISKFLDESWKDVTLEIGQPIVKELIKNVVNVVSKLVEAVPADELELD